MTKETDSHLYPYQRVENLPRILEALRQSVREALMLHKRAGNPVAVWRDGRVEWIKAEDILRTSLSKRRSKAQWSRTTNASAMGWSCSRQVLAPFVERRRLLA